MSLPPGFLDELRDRLSIAQVVGRKVSWDMKKSNQGKGDYWAPCPFHQEKTASFHVEDRKGFYYCFGCHAKGDALNFVRETENVGFMEAVEILAREAGMAMPARDPQAQKKADKTRVLADIMEQAVQYYRLQLKTNGAAGARDYLQSRGLPEATLDRFEIGFAANARVALFQHLSQKGCKAEDIIEAGLCIKPDDGGSPYDRFRGRIMFPIRDARGRCIAFGGRALDPNARAKYLNSNETLLFDKGRSLYNFGPAREAAGKIQSLIVAEGYMDVIALSQAGFEHSVAPLGTAITEDQLHLMWRISSEPIIALDGDTAGLRAAQRLIDIALPLLEAGKSLRFCLLPEGQDPDDLIKSSGAPAMQKLLDQAQPMVRLLWLREVEGKDFDSPERRAALDANLRKAINTIRDSSIKNHYMAALRELRAELFAPIRKSAPRPQWSDKPWSKTKPNLPTPGTKSSMLGQKNASGQTQDRIRESIILTAAILFPEAAEEFESLMERCPIKHPDLARIRTSLLAHLHSSAIRDNSSILLNQAMADSLGFDPLEKLRAIKPVQLHPHLKSFSDPEMAKQTLLEELHKHAANVGADLEIKEAEQDMTGLADEGLTWRVDQAAQAREKASRSRLLDNGSSDADGENLSKYLQKLIDSQVWVKKKH